MNVSGSDTAVIRDTLVKVVTKNVIVFLLGIFINYINASLVQTFRKQQIFNTNPRYILFCHLVINDMIQVTTAVVLFLLSYILYTINTSLCCALIILALITNENTPLNLACMAVECYVAICLPLRHVQICTVKRTHVLIGLLWLMSLTSVLPDLFVVVAYMPAEFFQSRIFCLRLTAFPVPIIQKKEEVTYALYLVIVWIIIFYTYFQILFTAKTASKDSKKARDTIILHGFQVLLCMATYVEYALKHALKIWFPRYYSDSLFACYIIIQIFPRSISPIIYGVRDKKFRKYLRRHLICKITS
ncbi:unnamed protein product [Knipowitschia caucasica]